MTGSGRKPDSYEAHMALQHRFVRRENTFWLLLILLKRRALKRGDHETATLIEQVIARANEGDAVKMMIMAMMREE